MGELKERAAVLAGAALLAGVGRDRFYRWAQARRGLRGRIASAFCQGHAGRVGQNYAIFVQERDKERITDIATRFYADDSLHGYADEELLRAGDLPLEEQDRGLILRRVVSVISKQEFASVLEIGTGNGDVIARLAQAYPHIKFIGVDLSVKNARRKHVSPNLEFQEGYALDLLRARLNADLVFATSTFCIFAPKELRAYLDALSGAKQIVLVDPVTAGNRHEADPIPHSFHMDLYMWWHNYFGYLASAGFIVEEFGQVRYRYPHNPDAQFVVVSAVRR